MSDDKTGSSGSGSSPKGNAGGGTASATAGGISGTHPTTTLPPILIGPSTGAGLNTVRSAIIPVACWRVEDLRFEFDSSIIRPDMRVELAALVQLRQQHPGAPLSVFGHADPSGNDDYNKILSGRRATVLYALLTRDTALWDQLFTNAQGTGDNWRNRVEPIMQAALGQPEGEVAAGDRQALFLQYMEFLAGPNLHLQKTEFIGQGADAHGKADFQGCGEFNPSLVFSLSEQQAFDQDSDKTERNAENAKNRRVMVLLFRPGTLVDPTKWPCPRANEGVAGCRRRFFSDGDHRRANQANRREFALTKDTFACRFYDRLTNRSPCEVNPQIPTATVEFILDEDDDFAVDSNDPAATFVRIGLWDHAFNCAANTLFNNEQEADNFVGADLRRFYLRVIDTAASGLVHVKWHTLHADASTFDAPADETVTLTETGQGTHVFVSKALMLVTDNDDANQATNSGLPSGNPNAGIRNRGQADFRIRRADLQAFVEAEYTPAGGKPVKVRLPVFEQNPESRRTLPVQILVLRVAAGGAGVIPTDAAADVFNIDLRQMREIYGRLGIAVQTVVAPGTNAANIVTVNGDSLVLIDPPAGINPGNVSFNDEATLGTRFPAIANTVRMFYCGGLSSGNRGEAWPDDPFAGRSQVGAAFSNLVPATYNITHEVGHILTNKAPGGGHYNAPTVPANNRFCNNQNLMRNGTSVVEGVLESKRLYDAPDRDNNNAVASILRAGNRFLRPFSI